MNPIPFGPAVLPRFLGKYIPEDSVEKIGVFELQPSRILSGRGKKTLDAYQSAAEELSPEFQTLEISPKIHSTYRKEHLMLEVEDDGDILEMRHSQWQSPVSISRKTTFLTNLLSRIFLGDCVFSETPSDFLKRGLETAREKLNPQAVKT